MSTTKSEDFNVLDISGQTAGIVSKERKNKFGEVLTPQWVIDHMLDEFENETKTEEHPYKGSPSDMWATAFEPGVGQGGFQYAILDRKVKDMYRLFGDKFAEHNRDAKEYWQLGMLYILSRMFGVEIQEDNVQYVHEQLFEKVKYYYEKEFGEPLDTSSDFAKSAQFLIQVNQLHGDALTLNKVDSDVPLTKLTILPNYNPLGDPNISEYEAPELMSGVFFRFSNFDYSDYSDVFQCELLKIYELTNEKEVTND